MPIDIPSSKKPRRRRLSPARIVVGNDRRVVRHLERMIYVDDSGHPRSGMVVYGWVEFSPDP